MCGRYRLSKRKQLVEEHFDVPPDDAYIDDWIPRYNIAPTQPLPVIRQNPKKPIREMSHALGIDSDVGERCVRRCKND
jgi:putative SOS response-associated peptidase YedK